jgi:DNA anti-recombination protein RmuC
MSQENQENVEIKVDIGVLKTQVLTLTALCNKMDVVIEKLVDQHDRHLTKVYATMEDRRLEKEADIGELHDRIDVVLDKMQTSEHRIMDEIKSLRNEMQEHNKREKAELDSLLQWKWMIAGGIVLLSWLVTNFGNLIKLPN